MKLNNLTNVNNNQLAIKEYEGQRVVTFKDVDILHERPDGTASRNFNENKTNDDRSERIFENTDYFKIKLTDNEIRS
jgi:hypothetical protein